MLSINTHATKTKHRTPPPQVVERLPACRNRRSAYVHEVSVNWRYSIGEIIYLADIGRGKAPEYLSTMADNERSWKGVWMCDLIWQINANRKPQLPCILWLVLSFVSIPRCPRGGPRGPSPNRPNRRPCTWGTRRRCLVRLYARTASCVGLTLEQRWRQHDEFFVLQLCQSIPLEP